MGFNKFSNDMGNVGDILSQVGTVVSGNSGVGSIVANNSIAAATADKLRRQQDAEKQAELVKTAKLQQQVDDLQAAAATQKAITPSPVVNTPPPQQQALSVVAPASPVPQNNNKIWIAGVVVGLIVLSGGIVYFATKKQS